MNTIKKYQKMIFTLALVMVVWSLTAAFNALQAGYINVNLDTSLKGIVDGDTGKILKNGRTVSARFIGINTPETIKNRRFKNDVKKCKVSERVLIHLGLSAKEYVQDYYKYNVIGYTVIDLSDRNGRPLIMVEDVSLGLVENGLAVVLDYNNTPKEFLGKLIEVQKVAEQRKVGVWRYFNGRCLGNIEY